VTSAEETARPLVRRLWRDRASESAEPYAGLAGLLMTIPAVMLALMVVIGPFVSVIWTSLADTPSGFSLENYERFLEPDAALAIWRTLVIGAGSVMLEVAVALPLALLLNSRLPGRGAMRALVTLPWAIPTIAAATAFVWLADTNYGLFNQLGLELGLFDDPIELLSSREYALLIVTVAYAWKGLPLVFIIILSGLQSLPADQVEAARVDGAGRGAQIRHIVLPHLKSAIVLAAVLSGVYNFAQFDIAYLMTGGGPSEATTTLPILLYNEGFRALEDGRAAATGVVIFVAGLLTLTLWALWERRRRGRRA
jgi:multiple sugar transport system permease protein